MFSRASISLCLLALFSLLNFAHSHTVITYPGWRGDNLHSNCTVYDTDGLVTGGHNASGACWPYGMQWSYPCGGMPISHNRTKWPVKGGAVAFQPGWFAGHASAYIYINLGFGNLPPNMSNPMVSGIQIIGPTREPYPGTFCLPQVPLPVNASVKVGDNATIQIIETAIHGAALYNCVDITFAEPEDVPEVNSSNCFNSSQISTDLVFTTASLSGASPMAESRYGYFTVALVAILGFWLV